MLNNINTKGMPIAGLHQSHSVPQQLTLFFKHPPRNKTKKWIVCEMAGLPEG